MSPTISIFTRHSDLEPSANLPLTKVLEAIRQPRERVTKLIASIRSEPDKAKRRELKGQLPAICFGAQLKTRDGKASAVEKIQAESGIVCLDLDNIEDLAATRARLEGKKHILAVFVSPSGNGLKVLVPILGSFQTHWRALAHHMESEYQLKADEARKDVVGLCYASHDPAIWVAPDMSAVEVFAEVREDPRPRHQPGQTLIGHTPNDGEVLSEYLDAKNAEDALVFLSPNCEYPEWIEIGQAIHCQFGGSGQGLAIWDSWSSRGSKYAGTEDVSKHYQSFRASGITFRTVLGKAKAAGYKQPRRTTSTARAEIVPDPIKEVDTFAQFLKAELDGSYSLISWPWPILSELSYSLTPGSVTLLCGAPGASKSWLILACLRHWHQSGVDAHVLMLEGAKNWHKNRLLAMLEGDRSFLNHSEVKNDPSQRKTAAYAAHKPMMDAVGDRLWCESNVTFSACAKWVEDRCAAGARVLVVDPITLADAGAEKGWEADARFAKRCEAAAAKYGASIVLVTHPRKASPLSKGPPTADDMAGGVVYSRIASSILYLSPSAETEEIDDGGEVISKSADRKIMVLKSRNGIGTGKQVAFAFRRFSFEEVGKIDDTPKPRGPKELNARAVAVEKTIRAKKHSSTPHPREDSFLGPTP